MENLLAIVLDESCDVRLLCKYATFKEFITTQSIKICREIKKINRDVFTLHISSGDLCSQTLPEDSEWSFKNFFVN